MYARGKPWRFISEEDDDRSARVPVPNPRQSACVHVRYLRVRITAGGRFSTVFTGILILIILIIDMFANRHRCGTLTSTVLVTAAHASFCFVLIPVIL